MIEKALKQPYRILVADDEETFRKATTECLRAEGYGCDCVPNSDEAVKELRSSAYDLLISDIRMPGNHQLGLIQQVQCLFCGTPVILVTGFPSVDSASQAIGLPVIAYLPKPIDFEILLKHIQDGILRSQAYSIIRSTKQRVSNWCEDLTHLESLLADPLSQTAADSFTLFANLTLTNAAGTLVDLSRIVKSLTDSQNEEKVVEVAAEAHLISAQKTLQETIAVLESTKGAYKSKVLSRLRHKLQVFVDELDVPRG